MVNRDHERLNLASERDHLAAAVRDVADGERRVVEQVERLV
jgi:hypothetical protein